MSCVDEVASERERTELLRRATNNASRIRPFDWRAQSDSCIDIKYHTIAMVLGPANEVNFDPLFCEYSWLASRTLMDGGEQPS
jgi:hypothetical protein